MRVKEYNFNPLLLLMLTSVMLLGTSCMREDPAAGTGGESVVTISLQTPRATGSLDLAMQNQVSAIDVLAFDKNGNFAYAASSDVISVKSDKGGVKSYSVEILLRPGNHDLMILANAGDIVQARGSLYGLGKDEVSELLVARLPDTGWPTDGSRPLPMWGEIDNVSVSVKADGTVDTNIDRDNEVEMLRMHAAIDIELTDDASDVLQLETVRLYNYNRNGLLIPDKSKLSGGKATAPSLPSDPDPVSGPAKYIEYTAGEDDRSTGEIFVFENKNGGRGDHPDIISLIVGGTYTGPDSDDLPVTAYYRVDFSQTNVDGSVDYMDLLRNHKYTITVTGVKSSGFTDPDEAYNSTEADITVSIREWDCGADIDIDAPGQRFLWLSDREFEIEPEGGEVYLDIETDTNWSVRTIYGEDGDLPGGEDWIEVKDDHGSAGAHRLTVTVSENPKEDQMHRTAYLEVKAGNLTTSVTVNQSFELDLEEIIPSIYTINNAYVTAFWRADQTGERLIKIWREMDNHETLDGRWTASVVEGREWIVLDTEPSKDPNLWDNGREPADMMRDDLSYQVESTARTVSGDAGTDGDIFFRIGLTGTYSPTPDNPARYGVVMLTYNENSKRHLIFVRQGENPDYLMRPVDDSETGQFTAIDPVTGYRRPAAVKFSPFNLTTESYNSNSADKNEFYRIGVNDQAAFTLYPSQGGAFFQWANSVYPRAAYNPNPNITIYINETMEAGYWNFISSTYESCPNGYRRVNDGSITGPSDGVVVGSEIRQSLWYNAVDGEENFGTNKDNFMEGYCADGWFDRREIVGTRHLTPANFHLGADHSAVALNDTGVAYRGVLLFNPYNHASLFFPFQGYRANTSYGDSAVGGAGARCYLWTSSKYIPYGPWYLSININGIFMGIRGGYDGRYGSMQTIRCVVDE